MQGAVWRQLRAGNFPSVPRRKPDYPILQPVVLPGSLAITIHPNYMLTVYYFYYYLYHHHHHYLLLKSTLLASKGLEIKFFMLSAVFFTSFAHVLFVLVGYNPSPLNYN
jgi:hypothetical protein